MKSVLTLTICLGLSATYAMAQTPAATGLQWHTNLEEARSLSDAQHKPIFGFFTGSDWCGWCRKLQNEVFSKPAFVQWANEHVILLELDFPRRTQLPQELAEQNMALQQAFNVRGYPTIWIFFAALNEAKTGFNLNALGSLGYPSGAEAGKEELKFLENANAVLANGN